MAAALQTVESSHVHDIHTDRIKDVEQLGAEITELSAYIYAATYRLLVLIREFDERGGWHQPGLCSCAHWLNFKCGIGMNAAREKVRVAHALKNLAKISAAFERGELSYSKVRAMTRIANTENEDYLLMIARHGTAYHMEKLVQKYRRAERLQDVEAANRQQRDRYLEHHYDEDGCLVIRARVPAEQGALIIKALEKALDDQFAKHRDVCPKGTWSTETAGSDTVVDACIKHGPHVSAETSVAEPEPVSARRADALAEVAETYLGNEARPATSGDRYQVVVHVCPKGTWSAETSETETPVDAHIEDGPHVSAETSRRLGCDCSIVRMTEDLSGEPLSIGRKTRSIPPAIRRALRFRDKGCRFPGCTNTRFVDGHHIRHWADGGETSLDNLVELCRHHHRLVHEGGYGCERLTSGDIVFTAPDATRLADPAPVRMIDEDPYAWFEKEMADFDIGPETCVPDYCAGDRIDWDLAVAALFPTTVQP